MRPPICAVCGRHNFDGRAGDAELDFGTVRFADYEPLPDRRVGHPKGLEWFCPDHLEAARELSDLPTHVAVRTLANQATTDGEQR